MKTIADYIRETDEVTLSRAQNYLDSDKVKSVKLMHATDEPNEFEAFILEDGQVLMPGIEVNEAVEVLDIHCQCESEHDFCVHKVALLLAAQAMIDTTARTTTWPANSKPRGR